MLTRSKHPAGSSAAAWPAGARILHLTHLATCAASKANEHHRCCTQSKHTDCRQIPFRCKWPRTSHSQPGQDERCQRNAARNTCHLLWSHVQAIYAQQMPPQLTIVDRIDRPLQAVIFKAIFSPLRRCCPGGERSPDRIGGHGTAKRPRLCREDYRSYY